ncbi:MAG: hypothetical protein GF317_07950 [Candidatus Lokiarchaeota archaeon]|nr:hypothetical protein [Candidatus Lokiarchaeota archaeon]MBD3199645.1 hypothetical protein [Candidatus Lokiarchaeota archaeon]
MGFVCSIFLISFFGFISHYWYRKYGLAKGKLAWISYYLLIVIGFILLLDLLIYLGLLDFLIPLFNYFPWINIDNGKDFMWNSFIIFGIDWNISYNDSGLYYFAILNFLSYPVWFMFFKDLSRKFFGGNKHRPYQKGISYLITSPSRNDNTDKNGIKIPEKA